MRITYLAIIAAVVALIVSSVPDRRVHRAQADTASAPDTGSASAAVAHTDPGTTDHDDLCSGGPANVVDARFDIARVETTSGGGDVLHLELALDSHYQGSARSVASIEIADDRGKPLRAPVFSPVLPLTAHQTARFATTTPPGLAHGFYRVSAAIASESLDRSQDSFDIAQLFLRVDRDGVTPISHDDWLMQSNAHLATQSFDTPDPEATGSR